MDEHIDALKELFSKFRQANVKLSPKKCLFVRDEVPFLGHIVGSYGIRTDPRKVQLVKDFPCPTTCKDPRNTLQKYLGLLGYYRKYLDSYAEITGPLYDLLGSKKEFVWTDVCQDAFERSKRLLLNAPSFVCPRFGY